ncbi:polysaccharide deacetylase family protein [Aestuariibacter sp. AA17]|uniref:Polysaccharide deacetylase family protein n=1 Tax=Fluctibacter corallii TaxID=2984329 RepID=A0ABT3AAY8_9ALTE|nr:polysaccharide deacetylase family protein [Aestuariibacter sp. AA17]MCV2885833.1 polysaccharide deacetylase family protein [Aestuariibacter sp. AA17]
MKLILKYCVLIFTLILVATKAQGEDNGVILVYHHVSTSTPASTSISPEKFKKHLDYLSEHHHVMALGEMVNKLQRGESLPPRSVAITFDDGYRNIFENAHPLLREKGIPYTVFINPPQIEKRNDQLTWQQVKTMSKEGVTFANHTSDHRHLLEQKPTEDQHQWLERITQDINEAQQALVEQLGDAPKWLAYPYGEYSQTLKERVLELGYIGFGQHSGAVASFSDFGALPRFAAAGIYANLDTLKVKLNSLAMPVTNKTRQDPFTPFIGTQPLQIITLETSDLNTSQVNCFFNGKFMETDKTSTTVVIKPPQPLAAGRTRINCTAPSKTQAGRFYWYSQPWFVPNADGSWLE